jgi:DNA polymerase I-like protein with 3'-5' exonuclease and polymerase domains/uracil-DNA glycosylase
MKFLPLFPTGLPPAAIDKSGPLRRNPHCGRCSLSERAIKRCLPPVGEKGGLLLVAGSPDKQSNATGISFSSGGGRYAVGVAKKFWSGPLAGTYAAACHAGELAVEEKHLAKCRPYLRSFIDEIAPTRIVLLGGAAIRGVLGRYVHARSARCGFSWVTVDGRKVPVILLMNPDHPDQGGELDGRFAKAAFESDMQWACTVPDDFLRERREFIESSVYSVVSDEATAIEAEALLLSELKRTGKPLTWDVETRGKMFDSDFRIISAALGVAGGNSSFVWNREALVKGSASSDALVRLLKDPDLCWVEQGSYDELAAMCYFGTPIAGERRDVRLVRKALDCAVKAADLDTLSELVGTGGYKADFEAHLKNAREKVKKWNPAQGMLFDECPDPTARQRLWELSRLEDKKIFDEYEKSYLYALVPSDVLPLYNARDQITTGLLHEELWPKLQADPGLVLLWNEVTGPASRSYTWAEYWGAPMSRGAIRAVIQESKSAKAALEPQLRAHLTPQFAKVSFSSDEQVAGFLFTPTELGGLGLPVVKKTDTGAPSVDAEALETLYAQFNHPFIELFSAYVSQDTDRKKVEEFERFLREDGRMHPTYLLDGTETGRPSCHAPNLFNMKSPEECDSCSGKGCENCDFTGATAESRRIRACFEAPEDSEILETDLNQVELRGMAVLADEPVLIEAYLHGKDIHNGTIEFVFEVSGRKISRRYAKIGNFLIPYGGRARTFAASLKIPIEMARVIFDAIEGRYPNVKSAKARFLEEARRTGTTCNYWFVDGLPVPCQKRPLWNLDSSDNYLRNKAENGVFNTRIQGTFSGSLVLASHARIVKYILANGLQHLWRPAVNVYDSIIGPCHKALLPLAARMTVDVMTSWVVKWMPDGKPFPLEADCKVGRNLGVAKKYKPPKTYAEAVAECRRLGLDEVLRKRPVLNG